MPFRKLAIHIDTSTFRNETLRGVEYLVVPSKAIQGNSVIRAQGSEGPEFVPENELIKSVPYWNNRPIVDDHPKGNTANTQEVLENRQFGLVLNTVYSDGYLRPELWFDTVRAKELGGVFESTVNDIKNGVVKELSIGAGIDVETRDGTSPSGESYGVVWHNLNPDHLAVGLSGDKGACSVESGGCGAGRTAKGENVSKERALRMFRSAQDAGKSDNQLRNQLWVALSNAVPAFFGIDDTFQESKTVIYSTWPMDSPTWFMWRHHYKSNESGVELTGEPESVVEDGTPTFVTTKGEKTMDQHETAVRAFIASEGNQFNESHFDSLVGMSPESFGILSTIQVAVEPQVIEEVQAGEIEVEAVETVSETAVPEGIVPDGFELLPTDEVADMRVVLKAYKAEQADRRAKLTKQLKAAKCNRFTDEDMAAMSPDMLGRAVASEQTSSTVFAGAESGARVAAEEAAKTVPTPKPFSLALAKENTTNTGVN